MRWTLAAILCVCVPRYESVIVDKVYWTDTLQNVVKRANANDFTEVETVISGATEVTGVVLDVGQCDLYYAVNGDAPKIMKAKLDGSQAQTFYTVTGERNGVYDMKMDSTNRRIFWSEDNSAIRHTAMDSDSGDFGTVFETVTDKSQAQIFQKRTIALDLGTNKIYYADQQNNRISYQTIGASSTSTEAVFFDYFTSDYNTFGNMNIYNPTGLWIDSSRNLMYADSDFDSISRFPLPTGTSDADEVEMVRTGLLTPSLMQLVDDTILYWTDEGAKKLFKGTVGADGTVSSIESLTFSSTSQPFGIGFMRGSEAGPCFTTTTTTITSTTTTTTTFSTTSTSTTRTTTTTLTTTTTTTTTLTTTSSTTSTSTTVTSTSTTTLTTTTTTTLTTTSTTVTSTSTTTTITMTTTLTTTSTTVTTTSTTVTITSTTTTTTTTTKLVKGSGPVRVQGSFIFDVDGVGVEDVKGAAMNTLGALFEVQEDSLNIGVSLNRRLQESNVGRRLVAETFVVVYTLLGLGAADAVGVLDKAKEINADPGTLKEPLALALMSRGAIAQTIEMRTVSQPVMGILSDGVPTDACGTSYCPDGRIAKSGVSTEICAVMTCAEAFVQCCDEDLSGGTDVNVDGASSTIILLGVCAGVALLCCFIIIGYWVRRHRRETNRFSLKAGSHYTGNQSNATHDGIFSISNLTASARSGRSGLSASAHSGSLRSVPLSPCSTSKIGTMNFDGHITGKHELLYNVAVRELAAPDSEAVGKVPRGKIVEVVDIADYLKTHGAMVGRIRDPPGWIPLQDSRGTEYTKHIPEEEGAFFALPASPGLATSPIEEEFVTVGEFSRYAGEWWPYTQQGFRSGSVVKVDGLGRVWVDGSRSTWTDLYSQGGTIIRKDGWMLNQVISTDREILWSVAAEHSVVWKRILPAHEYTIGAEVQLTQKSQDVPLGTRGNVISIDSNGSIRVKFPGIDVSVPPRELQPVEMAEGDDQARAMLDIVRGEWRLYDGDVLYPGLVVIASDGYTLYNGMHWPEQDLLVLGGELFRGDGWGVKMDTANSHELTWHKDGEGMITWRRVRVANDFSVGEKVRWTEETHDVPMGTIGEVVGHSGNALRVAFGSVVMELTPGQVLPPNDDVTATYSKPVGPEMTLKEAAAAVSTCSTGPANSWNGTASPSSPVRPYPAALGNEQSPVPPPKHPKAHVSPIGSPQPSPRISPTSPVRSPRVSPAPSASGSAPVSPSLVLPRAISPSTSPKSEARSPRSRLLLDDAEEMDAVYVKERAGHTTKRSKPVSLDDADEPFRSSPRSGGQMGGGLENTRPTRALTDIALEDDLHQVRMSNNPWQDERKSPVRQAGIKVCLDGDEAPLPRQTTSPKGAGGPQATSPRPGAAVSGPTLSNRARWGGSIMQAVAGPINSGMTALTSRIRSNQPTGVPGAHDSANGGDDRMPTVDERAGGKREIGERHDPEGRRLSSKESSPDRRKSSGSDSGPISPPRSPSQRTQARNTKKSSPDKRRQILV